MRIPENLSSLKRPALQALCKKVGIKANGKNTDMVKALEALRESFSQESNTKEVVPSEGEPPMEMGTNCPATSEPNDPHPSPVATSVNKEEAKVVKKKGGRKGGRRRKTRSKKEANINTSTESDPADSAVEESANQSPAAAEVSVSAQPDAASPRASRKRKRRDTHSISPNSSLCLAAKIPRLSIDAASIQSVANSTSRMSSTPNDANTTSTVETEVSPVKDSATGQSDLNEANTKPPFSPPAEDASISGSFRKRKRNSTFVLSPSQKVGEGEEAGKEEEKQRRLTFDLTPTVCSDESVSTTTDKMETESDVMAELQNILDKKVQEIKSAPDYKPVHSAASTLTSRLPVKSDVQKKFDKAHSKQFNNMRSIADIHELKRKRTQSTGGDHSNAKRLKLEKPGNVTRVSTASKVSHKTSSLTSRAKSTTSHLAAFKPSVTSVKKINCRFSHQAKPTTKTWESQPKTPNVSKMITFTGKKTPGQVKKSVYNAQESLKKKPSYKPYRGPLPKFGEVRH